jgi:hypothetical protein
MQNLHHWTWDHDILYADRSLENEQRLIKPFFEKKYEREGRLEVKSHILFHEDNSRTDALRQMKYVRIKKTWTYLQDLFES